MHGHLTSSGSCCTDLFVDDKHPYHPSLTNCTPELIVYKCDISDFDTSGGRNQFHLSDPKQSKYLRTSDDHYYLSIDRQLNERYNSCRLPANRHRGSAI